MNNETNVSNIPENKIELSANTLYTIDLLADAAKKTSKEEEINRLEREIQELEEEKNKKWQELNEELELEKRELRSKTIAIKHSVDQKNNVLKQNIDTMKKRLEEYEQDVKAQEAKMKEEQRQLKELEFLPQTRENMLKKADLEWGLTAYTEYLDFMNEEIDTLKNSINQTEEKVKGFEKVAHDELKKEVMLFNDKYNIEYGNKAPSVDNHPALLVMNDALEKKKDELAYYKQEPEVLKNEIIQAMEKGNEVGVVKEKLDTLTSLIGGKVSGLIDFNQLIPIEEKIATLQKEKQNVQTRMDQDDYINKEQKEIDQKTIDKNQEEIEKYSQEIDKLEEQIELQKQIRNLPTMKKEVQRLEKFIKTQQEQLTFIRKYSKESATDILKVIDRHSIEKTTLENKIKELENIKKMPFVNGMKHEVVKYMIKIEECKKENSILSEKTDEDYIEWKRRDKDITLLKTIDEDIKVLTEKANAIGEHDPYQLTEDILLEYQKKNEKEEVLNFIEPKQTLIEKIKSLDFKQKAIDAISSIKSHFSKREKFDYDQMVDNVSEDMNNEEAFSNVQETQEPMNKESEIGQLPPAYNDSTYGMEEANEENSMENSESVRTR